MGSHLLFDLVLKGEKVRALKRKNSDPGFVKNLFSSHPDLFEKIEWMDGDVLDIFSLQEAMKQPPGGAHGLGTPPAQAPFWQVSLTLQKRLSLHGPPSLVGTEPHMPAVHWPTVQGLFWQSSQALPSLAETAFSYQ